MKELSFSLVIIFKTILHIIFIILCFSAHVCSVTQSWPTLCSPMDSGVPGSSVHGIFQAGILEWVAISYSWSRDQTEFFVSPALAGAFLTVHSSLCHLGSCFLVSLDFIWSMRRLLLSFFSYHPLCFFLYFQIGSYL